MADTKISALTALTGANVDVAADVLPIVDTGVTTTKKIVVEELAKAIAATQAQQETGTSTSTVVTPGRQHFHPSAAKAWALITISGGTPTLAGSYNVSGITDNNVGDITITFSTALSSASYAYAVSGVPAGSGFSVGLGTGTTRATGSIRLVWIRPDSGAAVDPAEFSVTVFGDI